MQYKPYLFTGLGIVLGSLMLIGVLGTALSFAGTSNGSVTANVDVGYAVYISIPTNTASLGSLYPGTSAYTNVPITVQDNGGNLAANILVSGAAWASGSNSIPAGNTLYSNALQTSYTGTALSSTLTDTHSTIAQPTITTNSPSNSVYFGVAIPAGTPAGLYTQALTFQNENYSNAILSSSTAQATLTVTVQGVCYISLSPNSIGFGPIVPTANVPTNVQVTDTDNGGNAAANVLVGGTAWSFAANTVGQTKWDAATQSTYAGTSLTNTLVTTGITIAAPSTGTPSANSPIYFGLAIPAGTASGTYTQTITLENSC